MMWWLSFCDADRAKGEQFLGAAIVVSDGDIAAAAMRAWELGINPGGEVAGVPFDGPVAANVPDDWCNRLLTKAEAESFDAMMDKRMLN